MLAGGRRVESQKSIFDSKFSPFFRFTREALNKLIQPRTFQTGLELNIRNNKVQKQLPDGTPFPCSVNGPGARSQVVPNTVHKLR